MVLLLAKRRRGARRLPAAVLLVALLGAIGCTVRIPDPSEGFAAATFEAGKGRPELWTRPERWVLIRNPAWQEGDPEGSRAPMYLWADRDHLPLTVNRAVGGLDAVLAPPDAQARYAGDKVPPPPGR